jgi:hypothetical protein
MAKTYNAPAKKAQEPILKAKKKPTMKAIGNPPLLQQMPYKGK